ncbi:TPA: SH3 domain-containing protein, partial [Streptococcus suis]|nr:SH3 domain-containing protein [Streptococcus suis]
DKPGVDGKVVATYTNGEQFNYDSVYIADGYIWVSYVSHSGVRRYVAAGEESNRRNVVPYGTFK